MECGERELKRGSKGPDVAELQLRLAGFRGTVPDGDFGPGTERPAWVPYDVRSYEPKHLKDEMFCITLKALDNRRPILF